MSSNSFRLLIEEITLILIWAHTAPESALVNFGDCSKLGSTRENYPDIGKNGQKRVILAVFQKFQNYASPLSSISLQLGA